LLGKTQFSIYDVSDDGGGAVEQETIWKYEYRFDRQISHIGQIISLDFANSGMRFATGSSFGHVCMWDIPTRRLERVINIEKQGMGGISIIRFFKPELIIVYSKDSKNLIMINLTF